MALAHRAAARARARAHRARAGAHRARARHDTTEHYGSCGGIDALTTALPKAIASRSADLLARSFGHDTGLCAHCGGKLRLHAVVQDPASIRRILRHRGEPTEPPPLSPARGPPYWQSQLLRRHADAPAERYDQQRDLVHT